MTVFLLGSPLFAAVSPEPVLFFNRAGIKTLKERVASPAYKPTWDPILAYADGVCDPGSRHYADPVAFVEAARNTKEKNLTHMFPRRLSGWMETLSFAHAMTGKKKYKEHAIKLLHAGIDDAIVNVVNGSIYAGVRGDMMRALAIGLDYFSPLMTPEQRAPVVEAARKCMESLAEEFARPDSQWHAWTVPHNFSGVTGGAAGLLALVLREDFPDKSREWLGMAETIVLNWLDAAFEDKGANIEGVDYMQYGLGNALMLAEALARVEKRRAIIEHPKLKMVSYFLAMQILPGASGYEARNDSRYDSDRGESKGTGAPFLLLLASGFNDATRADPLAAWLWTQSRRADKNLMQIAWHHLGVEHLGSQVKSPAQLIPAPYGEHFKKRGLCVWRTGWAKDDTYFAIEAGHYIPVTHNQGDKGHFTLYGLGQRWAVDVGYGNNRDPKGRSQTVTHSCVLVDGKGQALSGGGLGTDGDVLDYINNNAFGYALIDAKSAYNKNDKDMPGVPVTKALRHAFYVRPSEGVPAYAVVLDDIEEEGAPHAFTWQMITWETMQVSEKDSGTFVVAPSGGSSQPRMVVRVSAATGLDLAHAPLELAGAPGIDPLKYIKLTATSQSTGNPRFAALLAPLPAGYRHDPALSVRKISQGTLVSIEWPGRIDRILWNGDKATLMNPVKPAK
ncbi:heparinase II/III-family protein [Termitidicoccus mucosus]